MNLSIENLFFIRLKIYKFFFFQWWYIFGVLFWKLELIFIMNLSIENLFFIRLKIYKFFFFQRWYIFDVLFWKLELVFIMNLSIGNIFFIRYCLILISWFEFIFLLPTMMYPFFGNWNSCLLMNLSYCFSLDIV